jgi:hypothetical protein
MASPRRTGSSDRRGLRRRATEAPKPPCPWCGSNVSSVYRSKGLLIREWYRRRRQCADCRQDWPTLERLDVDLFVRELAARGLTLEDLGFDLGPDGDNGGQPMAPPLPHDASTWEEAFALLHELWGHAQESRPYDRAQKQAWAALLTCLEREASRAGYQLAP